MGGRIVRAGECPGRIFRGDMSRREMSGSPGGTRSTEIGTRRAYIAGRNKLPVELSGAHAKSIVFAPGAFGLRPRIAIKFTGETVCLFRNGVWFTGQQKPRARA